MKLFAFALVALALASAAAATTALLHEPGALVHGVRIQHALSIHHPGGVHHLSSPEEGKDLAFLEERVAELAGVEVGAGDFNAGDVSHGLKIEKKLGKGGFGVTYKAKIESVDPIFIEGHKPTTETDKKLAAGRNPYEVGQGNLKVGTVVAFKSVIIEESAETLTGKYKRVDALGECLMPQRLVHTYKVPHIADCFAAGPLGAVPVKVGTEDRQVPALLPAADKMVFYIMELAGTTSARGWDKGSYRPPLSHIAFILSCVSKAVEKMAELGVVHADLKEENVMLTTDADETPTDVKIIDWGAYKVAKFAGGDLRVLDQLFGAYTKTYSPVEVLEAKKMKEEHTAIGANANQVSQRDVFAIGAMAHKMLCGSFEHIKNTADGGMKLSEIYGRADPGSHCALLLDEGVAKVFGKQLVCPDFKLRLCTGNDKDRSDLARFARVMYETMRYDREFRMVPAKLVAALDRIMAHDDGSQTVVSVKGSKSEASTGSIFTAPMKTLLSIGKKKEDLEVGMGGCMLVARDPNTDWVNDPKKWTSGPGGVNEAIKNMNEKCWATCLHGASVKAVGGTSKLSMSYNTYKVSVDDPFASFTQVGAFLVNNEDEKAKLKLVKEKRLKWTHTFKVPKTGAGSGWRKRVETEITRCKSVTNDHYLGLLDESVYE